MVIENFVLVCENARRTDKNKSFAHFFDVYEITLAILDELEEATLRDYEYVTRKMMYYLGDMTEAAIPEYALEKVNIFFGMVNSDDYALELFNARSR